MSVEEWPVYAMHLICRTSYRQPNEKHRQSARLAKEAVLSTGRLIEADRSEFSETDSAQSKPSVQHRGKSE